MDHCLKYSIPVSFKLQNQYWNHSAKHTKLWYNNHVEDPKKKKKNVKFSSKLDIISKENDQELRHLDSQIHAFNM